MIGMTQTGDTVARIGPVYSENLSSDGLVREFLAGRVAALQQRLARLLQECVKFTPDYAVGEHPKSVLGCGSDARTDIAQRKSRSHRQALLRDQKQIGVLVPRPGNEHVKD